MIDKLINIQLSYIFENTKITDEYELDKIRYGIEVLNYEMSKLLIIFTTFALIGRVKEFVIITLLVLLIRPRLRGNHFNSYVKCLVFTLVFYISIFIINLMIGELNNKIQMSLVIFEILYFLGINYYAKFSNLKLKNQLSIKIQLITVIIFNYLLTNRLFEGQLVVCGQITIIILIIDSIWRYKR